MLSQEVRGLLVNLVGITPSQIKLVHLKDIPWREVLPCQPGRVLVSARFHSFRKCFSSPSFKTQNSHCPQLFKTYISIQSGNKCQQVTVNAPVLFMFIKKDALDWRKAARSASWSESLWMLIPSSQPSLPESFGPDLPLAFFPRTNLAVSFDKTPSNARVNYRT